MSCGGWQVWGCSGHLGATDEPETIKAIREMMEETFLEALDEVRIDMRLHREMGENLIQLLLEKEELMSDEVEAFFDQYGLHTPKPHLLTDSVDQVAVTEEQNSKG